MMQVWRSEYMKVPVFALRCFAQVRVPHQHIELALPEAA